MDPDHTKTNNPLKSFIDRIERLNHERAEITADIREVYAEAKVGGFEPKIMRKVIAARKMDTADRLEQEALIETYMSALGMLATTPLGEAALKIVAK